MPILDLRSWLALIFLIAGAATLIYGIYKNRQIKSQSSRVLISFSVFLLFVSFYFAKNSINIFFGMDKDPIAQYYIDAIAWTAFAAIAMHILNIVLWRGILSEDDELLIPNFIVYLTNFFILLVTFTLFLFVVLDKSVTILATSAGGLLLAIGYLAKHPLESIFAGLSFTLAPMFKKGDRVSIFVEFIGEYIGTIKHMGWLHVSMQSKEGHIVHVQNMLIEKAIVTNFSQPKHKPCYTTEITLEYEVPMHKGYMLLKSALEDLSDSIDKFSIRSEKFSRFGITYLIRFWCSDKQNYDEIVHAINSLVYYKIQKHQETDFGYDKFGTMNAARVSDKSDNTHKIAARALRLSLEEKVGLLRNVDIFESLDDSEILVLAEAAEPEVFGPPEKVVRQGDPGESMFVIVKGHARIYLQTLHHEAIELVTHGPGKYFGEMALLTGEPRGAHVSASDDLLVLEIPKTALARIFSHQPSLAGKIAQSVAKMQAQNKALIEERNHQGSESDEKGLAEAIRLKVHQFFGLLETHN